jgi:Lar family restriction alleviation protein
VNVIKNKLKPCPFCGSKKVEISESSFGPVNMKPYAVFQSVWCDGCNMDVSMGRVTEKQAIKMWNKRA